MKVRILIILNLMIVCALSINQGCTSDANCPTNSTCISNFCQCNIPYILDCQEYAPIITDVQQNVEVTNSTSLYQTQYNLPDVYYSFFFQVCYVNYTLPNYLLSFSLYVDTGQPSLNADNFVGNININLEQLKNSNGQCVDIVQYQIKLDQQPNTQVQNLIVALQLIPISESDQITDAVAQVGILVLTKQMVSSDLLIKLAIGIMSFAVFVTICIVIFCCYQRYKRRKAEEQKLTYHQQQVELFKKNTPQMMGKEINIPPMTTCSICLGDFQPQCKLRKTVCKHLFHSECIDSWCAKNLNCPVCRLDLDQNSIKNKQKQYQTTGYNWNQNSLSGRQQLLPGQQTNRNDPV